MPFITPPSCALAYTKRLMEGLVVYAYWPWVCTPPKTAKPGWSVRSRTSTCRNPCNAKLERWRWNCC